MKRWIGFLLSLCLWLTGCAAPAAESVPARPPVTTPEMPAAGELRLLYDAAPDTLDLFADNSGERLSLAACTADTLLEFDDKGALCSALAESWEYDASSRVWTLTLCPDAQWVDEKGNPTAPVTAEDFVAAARPIIDPAVGSPAAATLRALIENAEEYYTGLDADDPAEPIDFEAVGVAAPDARTLCYTLKKDAPGFPARLTDWPFLPLAPETAASQLSCGPYCLAAYERCGEIVLQKKPRLPGRGACIHRHGAPFLRPGRVGDGPDACRRGRSRLCPAERVRRRGVALRSGAGLAREPEPTGGAALPVFVLQL